MQKKLNGNAQAVLDVIRSAHHHPTALEIYETVRAARPRIGMATVYRMLHYLAEQGYIKEIGSPDCHRYDSHTSRHDHAVCTQCGALLDIPIEVCIPLEVLQTAAKAAGVELKSHEVRLYGLCPSCQAQSHHSDNPSRLSSLA